MRLVHNEQTARKAHRLSAHAPIYIDYNADNDALGSNINERS
jgi:hypothetical protein